MDEWVKGGTYKRGYTANKIRFASIFVPSKKLTEAGFEGVEKAASVSIGCVIVWKEKRRTPDAPTPTE
jgi:hypothetical protein